MPKKKLSSADSSKGLSRPAPIKQSSNPRAGWAESIKAAVAKHGNELTPEDREWLDAPLDTEFDQKEWQW